MCEGVDYIPAASIRIVYYYTNTPSDPLNARYSFFLFLFNSFVKVSFLKILKHEILNFYNSLIFITSYFIEKPN